MLSGCMATYVQIVICIVVVIAPTPAIDHVGACSGRSSMSVGHKLRSAPWDTEGADSH